MDINLINTNLIEGNIADLKMLPHVYRLTQAPFVFTSDFGLDKLPTEPGLILIRGARQYGKSTWLEQQVLATIREFGAGSAFYLNGDFIPDIESLAKNLESCALSFPKDAKIKRIFIDEITALSNWEIILKRLIDNGVLREILVVTTGSKATDLRRGAERLPGRKGKLSRSHYLFTPISYKSFYNACHKKLKNKTLPAYLLSGGSPIACTELATQGMIPEYVIQLVRDWVEGEINKTGRHRSALLNILSVLFRFGGNPLGQAKLAREANLANNTVSQGYIELLNDLGCVVPAYPIDIHKKTLILRKPCKYHYMNTLVAAAYHPNQLRSPEDFMDLPEQEQGIWYEWLVAQELQRLAAIRGGELLAPMAFWQSNEHEVDFYDIHQQFIEVKRGKCNPLEFAWFAKNYKNEHLSIINKNSFSTESLEGLTLESFLLNENASVE